MGACRSGTGLRPFHTSPPHCRRIELRDMSRRSDQDGHLRKPTDTEHGLVFELPQRESCWRSRKADQAHRLRHVPLLNRVKRNRLTMSEKISRRDFLKLASVGAAAMRLLRQLLLVFAILGVLFGVLLLSTYFNGV